MTITFRILLLIILWAYTFAFFLFFLDSNEYITMNICLSILTIANLYWVKPFTNWLIHPIIPLINKKYDK